MFYLSKTHMTSPLGVSLVFLLMCDIGHLVEKACEKCLCDVVLGSVRWHQAWCSPTHCVRSIRVVVGRSALGGGGVAESSCWQATGQDLSNNPSYVPRVSSCCPHFTNAASA